jgi:hypothetical protein
MEITFLNRTKEDSHDTIRVKINDVREESKKKIVNIINMKNWKRETLVPANVKDLILVWKRVMKSSKARQRQGRPQCAQSVVIWRRT